MTWYRYIGDSAQSFDAPDMIVYAVFDFRLGSGQIHNSSSGREMTHQLVVVLLSMRGERRKAPSLALEPLALCLLTCYELKCAVVTPTSASDVPRSSPQKPSLRNIARKPSACRNPHQSVKTRPKNGDGKRTPEPRCAAGELGGAVNVRTFSTHIRLVEWPSRHLNGGRVVSGTGVGEEKGRELASAEKSRYWEADSGLSGASMVARRLS